MALCLLVPWSVEDNLIFRSWTKAANYDVQFGLLSCGPVKPPSGKALDM
jgi:hypothetical protein